jgi:hypothetical protein
MTSAMLILLALQASAAPAESTGQAVLEARSFIDSLNRADAARIARQEGERQQKELELAREARERKDRDAADVALKQQEGKDGEAATQRLFDQQNEFFKSAGAKKPNQ